jgi:hypothetical protein
VVGPVVGAVALVMVAVVMVVFAVVVMFPMVLTVVMAGRVVGTVLGDGGSGATYGDGQGDCKRRGYARYRLHSCLLVDEFPIRGPSIRGRVVRGYAYPFAEVHNAGERQRGAASRIPHPARRNKVGW